MTRLPALPARSTDAVVAWLLGPESGSWPDTDGRPLAEQASPSYATVERREERRAFGDTRDPTGLPCNVAALAQVHACWPMLLAALSAFDADEPDSMGRTLRRVSAGVRLAPLLAIRGGRPLSVPTAALYKLTLGFGDLCAALLLEERLDADDPTPSVDALDGWLDGRPWLVGAQQVCAGSRAQIRRAWTALRASEPGEPLPDLCAPWFRQALAALMELEALAAASAGAARVHLMSGHHVGGIAQHLFAAARVPLWVEALRQVRGAGPAHPSLLFGSRDVPAALRQFIATVEQEPSANLDDALLVAARDPASRLMDALSLDQPDPPSAQAFLAACSG